MAYTSEGHEITERLWEETMQEFAQAHVEVPTFGK